MVKMIYFSIRFITGSKIKLEKIDTLYYFGSPLYETNLFFNWYWLKLAFDYLGVNLQGCHWLPEVGVVYPPLPPPTRVHGGHQMTSSPEHHYQGICRHSLKMFNVILIYIEVYAAIVRKCSILYNLYRSICCHSLKMFNVILIYIEVYAAII